MSSSQMSIRGLIFISALILSGCQMPVRPNREVAHPSPPINQQPAPAIPDTAGPPAIPDSTTVRESPASETLIVSSSPNKQTGSVVFNRLNRNFSGPICNDSAAIQLSKKRYAGNPKAFSNHLGDILPLLDYVSLELERRKLPAEFAMIPLIESWYQPHAIGSGGPSGMWQMIATTAKNHGIKIQAGYDGRFSVVDSTDAALSYLATLQGMFKDWQRAVMGYNAGEFRVLRAMRSSGTKSEGQDHWPYGLSPITYAYIAKLQALSCLISQPEKNNLSLPSAKEFTPLAAILVSPDSGNLDNIAKRYQLDADKLKHNNPAYKRGQISAQTPRRILMPAYLGQTTFTMQSDSNFSPVNPANTDQNLPTKAVAEQHSGSHEVKNGETLWSIANRYGMNMESLRKLNGLGRRSVLRIGQSLKLAP